jgi:protein SCO1
LCRDLKTDLSNNSAMSPSAVPSKYSPSKALIISVVGIVAAMIGILAAQLTQTNPPQLVVGTLLQPPRVLPLFSLVNQDKQPLTPGYFNGHWTLVYFGFTNCPDICPTTLATLADVEKKLSDLTTTQQPQTLFISVDTLRDTPEQIKTYLQSFSPHFIGATGTQSDIVALADAFSAPVSVQTKDNNVVVDHSAAIFVVNSKGLLRAVFSGPHQIDSLAADLRQLVLKDK